MVCFYHPAVLGGRGCLIRVWYRWLWSDLQVSVMSADSFLMVSLPWEVWTAENGEEMNTKQRLPGRKSVYKLQWNVNKMVLLQTSRKEDLQVGLWRRVFDHRNTGSGAEETCSESSSFSFIKGSIQSVCPDPGSALSDGSSVSVWFSSHFPALFVFLSFYIVLHFNFLCCI